MRNSHGTPIWFELMTSDPAAAGPFYEKVMGWSLGGFPGNQSLSGEPYRIFSASDGEGVAGIMKKPPQMDAMPPAWFFYIGVDDVDAAAAKVTALGGAVPMPPTDLPGVGRMAMATDPGGAAFYLMRGTPDQPSTSFKRGADGHGEWNELNAADDAAALAFYGELFGWTKDGAMPMGEMGEYSFLGHDGGVIGAMMKVQQGRPRWQHFFRTGQIDAAKARIEEGGGTVTWGPHEVPGGDWVIYATDPQGGAFGVVGSKE